jgi:predicted O-linked N-acetylglucosamine transferase (SPINDLY family)
MGTIPATLAMAIERHQAGQIHAAELIYRRILAEDPDHSETLHLLGVAAQQTGRNEAAVELFQRAIAVNETRAEFHSSLAVAYLELRRFSEAVACCRRALELSPACVEAHINLGNVWKHQGRLADGMDCYLRALELKPDDAEAHYNLGNVWVDRGELQSAAECYRRALQLNPTMTQAHNNLGTVFREQGRLDEAVESIQRAIQLRPDNAAAHLNLGLASLELGRTENAVAEFQRALGVRPDYPEALYLLGNICVDRGQFDEAIRYYERAVQLQPDFCGALGALVSALQHVCQWRELQPLAQRLIQLLENEAAAGRFACISPMCVLSAPVATTAAQQLRCAQQWVDGQLRAAVQLGRSPCVRPQKPATSKIRIGYLSADFRAHAVACLSVELFENHNRGRFEVFGYSIGPDDGSPMRRRLVDVFDKFVDIRDRSYADGARQIADDAVDILVDLTGYTKHARTQILALRPAPVQVNFLGYPGTMAAPFIDYVIVDDFVVPPDQQPFFTERLVHLPGCYQVNSRREVSPQVPSRTSCGLPEHAFVFGAFNSSHKIAPAVFDVWMELLKTIPGSVLWLLEKNRFAPGNLRRQAQDRGVSRERLIFAPRIPSSEHLARHRLVDLFLDTYPYNGHTTTSDALWAGCPVLTVAGATFASRVAGSLLHAVGLPELVTNTLDEYRDLALRLAQDRARLADLRARLEANRATAALFDATAFTRNLEAAFATMHDIRAAREQPRGFAVGRGALPPLMREA